MEPLLPKYEISEKDDIRSYGTILEEEARQMHRRRLRKRPFNTSRWMSKIPDDTLLSALSIPGTHDSAAYHSIWPFVCTQKLDIIQQLNSGIRYFDLRCGLRNGEIEMVHGRALLGLKLPDILTLLYTWLLSHPSEGIIAQIKQDRAPESSTQSFTTVLWSVLDTHPQFWRTFPTTPLMSELRGKIQLFRRFHGPPYRGIDVSKWTDNPAKPFTIHTWSGVSVTIQDHYNPVSPAPLPEFIAAKGADVAGLLERAGRDGDEAHWYINFASAYEINLWYQIPPQRVAMGGYWDFTWVVGINPRLCQYLKTRRDDGVGTRTGCKGWRELLRGLWTKEKGTRVRTGVLMMDFPEQVPELITTVIEMNYDRKGKKTGWMQPVHFMAFFLLLVFLGGAILVLVHGPVDRMWCPQLLHACVLRDKPWSERLR